MEVDGGPVADGVPGREQAVVVAGGVPGGVVEGVALPRLMIGILVITVQCRPCWRRCLCPCWQCWLMGSCC